MKAIILFLILCNSVFANMITIPLSDLDNKLSPADDLTLDGKRLSQIEALELKNKGIDLSKLDPENSLLYKNNRLDLEKSKSSIHRFKYHSALTAPTEFFRFSVEGEGQKYTLTASLYNHQSLLRSAMLRLLGYDVESPKYLDSFTVDFSSLKEKESFIESLVDSTLLSQSRWIKNNDKDSLSLELKGLVLEPSKVKSVSVYWPVMEFSRQKMRRSFRALFYLYVLTDLNQNVNNIPWQVGSVFDDELVLSHSYAYEFLNTTIDDFKWMHRKVNSLNDDDFKNVLAYSNYPLDVQVLLKEKLKSRVNRFSLLLKEKKTFNVDYKVNAPGVRNGKLLNGDFSNYIPKFWSEDPLSPYRFSEILKYFRSQLSYDTISSLLDSAVERFVPNLDSSDAVADIANKVKLYYRENGEVPIRAWVSPTANASISGNRSIVFGQYQANNAPIQLVDKVSYKLEAGLFGLISGLPSVVKPTGYLRASIQRSWSHVRAMPDLTTATSQEIKKVLIPKLMKNLGKVISQDISCSIKKKAWSTEEIIGTMKASVIYYDKSDALGKKEALALRSELVASGVEESQIILSAVLKEDICKKEEISKRNKNIEEFIKQFAADETITISDTLSLNKRIGAKVSSVVIENLSASVDFKAVKAILRSYMIRKVADGVEITIQSQKNGSKSLDEKINFFVDIMSNSSKWTKGKMLSNVYKVKLVDVTDKEKDVAMMVLREIFLKGSYGLLKEYYNPTKLESIAKAFKNTFKFFWRKIDKLKMSHEIDITLASKANNITIDQTDQSSENDQFWEPPTQEPTDLPLRDRQRKLFSSQSIKRVGNNYHNFLDNALSDLTFDWLSLGSSDQDPGKSVKGKSWKQLVLTESELTDGYPLSPTTRFELSYVGFQAKYKKVDKFLKQYDWLFSFKGSNFKIDRSLFNQMHRLKSYDLRATVIFYPSAFERVKSLLIENKNIRQVLLSLRYMYGDKKWDTSCEVKSIERAGKFCIPREMNYILKLRKNLFSSNRKIRTKQINNLYVYLMNSFQRPRVLDFVKTDNFFGSSFLSGYLEGDSTGYLNHTTDSVGKYNEDIGIGLFDHFATVLGINSYTIKAMDYNQGVL